MFSRAGAIRQGAVRIIRPRWRAPRGLSTALPISNEQSAGNSFKSWVAFMALLGSGIIVGTNNPKRAIAHCESDKIFTRETSSNFVADAIELVAPAVVNIQCYVDGILMGGISSGSGFIITEDGYIVTNAHVVAASSDGRVTVTTMNGVRRPATVHSIDTMSDIALVKMDNKFAGEKFPIVEMGSSSKIRPGEFVVALGSPMQLQNSASFGIVSASVRHASELGLMNSRAEYIQTDAAINQGNSGGPLINLSGQVIGINVMKAQGADGISFAIPVDTASVVIRQLMDNKHVVRPYVGMRVREYIPSNVEPRTSPAAPRSWWGGGAPSEPKPSRRQRGIDALYHTQKVMVVVEDVKPDSPAAKCGIQK
jgi:S1-C subfamily serine protease